MIRIRNWKLALLAWLFIALFIALGMWQLSRATEKDILLSSYNARMNQPALTLARLAENPDPRFYRVTMTGTFDNEHSFLLDNKIFNGQVGYEIYTPFHPKNSRALFLIDRGFVPLQGNRNTLPTIPAVNGTTSITGLINTPPRYVTFGKMIDDTITWPRRVEYVNVQMFASLLNEAVYPYIVMLDPKSPYALPMEWQIVIMGPERHRGYALQWFAFASTLLIIFVALNRTPAKK